MIRVQRKMPKLALLLCVALEKKFESGGGYLLALDNG